jgi:hypothetical protein
MATHVLRERCGRFQFPPNRDQKHRSGEKIETLESRLKRKDEVIAEIMEDFIRAKKQIGES